MALLTQLFIYFIHFIYIVFIMKTVERDLSVLTMFSRQMAFLVIMKKINLQCITQEYLIILKKSVPLLVRKRDRT